jgi:zinc transporter ZupT
MFSVLQYVLGGISIYLLGDLFATHVNITLILVVLIATYIMYLKLVTSSDSSDQSFSKDELLGVAIGTTMLTVLVVHLTIRTIY